MPSHETGFDLANSPHPARYRDNAGWTLSHPSSPVVPGGVVAGHKVLAAVQPGENLRDHRRPLADREIAEMPDFVVSPTISFQRSIMASFIAATDAKGRR